MTADMSNPATARVTQLNRQTEQVRERMRLQSETFWDFQDRLLDQMERASRAWFLRRHEGTHAALEAACAMCRSATPAEAMQEYVGWASGSIERLTRDALDAQASAAAIAEAFLGATHKVLGGPSQAGRADIMTATEADAPAPMRSAA